VGCKQRALWCNSQGKHPSNKLSFWGLFQADYSKIHTDETVIYYFYPQANI